MIGLRVLNKKMNDTKIEGIGQIAVAVTDIKRSIEFYRDKLGLSLLFEVPSGMAFFDCGGVRLMITEGQGDTKDHKTSVIYYRVSDVTAATNALKTNGVSFIREPQMTVKMQDHELWIGFLRDPDENLIGIMAEVPLA